MTPEEAPVTPDTPTDAAPEVEDTQPAVDYEARYTSLRPEFDRKSQRLAELEQYVASLQEPEQPDTEDEYEYEYEDPVARQKLAELEARLAEREQQDTLQRQQAERTSHIDSELESIEAAHQEEFSQEESDWLGNYALANPDENGKPDVRRAYEQYTKLLEGRKSKWVQGKQSDMPASGPGAVEVPDLDDSEARADYIDRMLG